MPYIKFRIASVLREHTHQPESAPLLAVIQEWAEGEIVAGLYAAAMEPNGAGGPLATRCTCGGGGEHYQHGGNLFVILPVDAPDFQTIHDYWRLPDARVDAVTAQLMATTHLQADVLAVCRGSCDFWHVTVDRPVYVPRKLAQTVREA